MRRLIENPVYMTYNEMEKKFDGKWVLVTNCDFNPCNTLLGGIPVAVADAPYEGQQDGFYDKFRASVYAPRADCDFDFSNLPILMGVYPIDEEGGVVVAERH